MLRAESVILRQTESIVTNNLAKILGSLSFRGSWDHGGLSNGGGAVQRPDERIFASISVAELVDRFWWTDFGDETVGKSLAQPHKRANRG